MPEKVSDLPRVTHLIINEAGIWIQVYPTPESPYVCLGQIPDVRIYFFHLFFYPNASYSKNKSPIIFILKIWLQEEN